MSSQIQPKLDHFVRRDEGSVALIFALCILGILGSVSLAIDFGRAHNVTTKVRAALDAAALAGAKLLNEDDLSDSDVKQRTADFFQAQLAQMGLKGATLDGFETLFDRVEGTVRTSVKLSVATSFGGVIGVPSVDASPFSTVRFKMKKIELALVVDITGSMYGSKLSALKVAARELIDILKASATYKGAVRVSLIPYAAAVNAGPYATAASGGASTDDCVVERGGGGAFKNDAPVAGRYVGTADSASFNYYSCPNSTVTPLLDLASNWDYYRLTNAVSGLSAGGVTAGHIGLAWGWYTLSPEWNGIWGSSKAARDYDPKNIMKVVVLMTDGAFNASYKNGGEKVPFGEDSTDPIKPGTSPYQALRICENIRNPSDSEQKIGLYTIAFNAPSLAESVLQECAGVENAYVAADAAELTKSFMEIARKLSRLAISQ